MEELEALPKDVRRVIQRFAEFALSPSHARARTYVYMLVSRKIALRAVHDESCISDAQLRLSFCHSRGKFFFGGARKRKVVIGIFLFRCVISLQMVRLLCNAILVLSDRVLLREDE